MSTLLRLGPLALAALVGVIVVDGGFVYDDSSALLENPVVIGQAPAWEAFIRDFWGRPTGSGFTTWRPLMPVLWAQIWKLWPNDPLPFRALSVVLHVLAVAMSMRFVHRLKPTDQWAAAVVGALFALHPLNTEAVSAIVAQADMLSFSLVLAGCTIALRPPTLRSGTLCGLAFLLACLVKESAVIFTPLAALLLALRPASARSRSLAVLPVAVVGIAVVAFQLALPRAAGIAMFTGNLAHQAQGAMLFVLGLHNVGRALLMTLWPWPLAPNHGYAAVELQTDALAPEAIVGGSLVAIGLLVGIWAIKRRSLGWIAALSFLYAPALLQSHWAVRLVTDLAERLLYPSILGISMLMAGVILHLTKKPAARLGILAACALAFLAGSYSSRRAWADDDALWIYAVRVEPRAALHHHNVSNTYFRRGDVASGAYHRLIYTYLVERYPEPVQWEVLERNQRLPAVERFIALPAALEPSDPCSLIRAFTMEAKRYEPLYEYVSQHWPRDYPGCGPWVLE